MGVKNVNGQPCYRVAWKGSPTTGARKETVAPVAAADNDPLFYTVLRTYNQKVAMEAAVEASKTKPKPAEIVKSKRGRRRNKVESYRESRQAKQGEGKSK